MNNFFKFIGTTAILLFFSAVLGLSAVNAAGAPPILYVTKTKSQININEKVTIHALSVSQDQYGPAPESISFYVNAEKSPIVVCNDKHYCGMTYWVTEKVKGNKQYKFTVKSTHKGATATKIVYVFIKNKVVGEAPKATEPAMPAQSADETPGFETIITSNHQPKVGETFSTEIYPKDCKGCIELEKIEVLLDGKVIKTCDLKTSITCGTVVGPFVATDIGEHKYEFYLYGKNGKIGKPWGKFWVNPAPQAVDDYPEYDKVITSGAVVKVGETFTATLYAKPGKTMYKVEKVIDESSVPDNCVNIGGCAISDISSKVDAADIGEHTYKFIISSKSGKSLTINGKFQVIAADEKDLKAPEVSISSNKDVLKLNESATLTVVASDNKAVSKIQILLFDGVVKECAGVNVCTYQIGPVTDKTYVTKYTYSALAYDAAGNNMYTGNKYVTVDIFQPAPAVEPTVSVEASKSKISTKDTVDFKAAVNPGAKKLTKLNILVNQALAKECLTSVCEYTGGPYAVGNVNYAATAFFSDGTHKTTGYYYIQVTDVPTVSIVSSPPNPTDTSAVMFTANATGGNKVIDHIYIMVNGSKIEKSCYNTAVCSFMGGPYTEYGGKNISYYAAAIFTDGSALTSDKKTLAIISTQSTQSAPRQSVPR